ncbi:MAG: hypothetical protein WCL60_04170 [Methylococcales bacterium]
MATLPLEPSATESFRPVNYDKSWGPVGPNDRLYWQAGLLCKTLDNLVGSTPKCNPSVHAACCHTPSFEVGFYNEDDPSTLSTSLAQ